MTKNTNIDVTQLQNIVDKVKEQGFIQRVVGYYRGRDEEGNHVTKMNQKYLLFKRSTELKDYLDGLSEERVKKIENSIRYSDAILGNLPEHLKCSGNPKIENPLISKGLPMGSDASMGTPIESSDPTPESQSVGSVVTNVVTTDARPLDGLGRPILSQIGEFKTVQNLRSVKDSLLIGFDAEWWGEPRRIISWQFSLVFKSELREYVFLKLDEGLRLDFALGCIFDDFGVSPFDVAKYTRWRACTGFDSVGNPIWEEFAERSELYENYERVYPLVPNDAGKLEPASFTLPTAVAEHGFDLYAKRGNRDWRWGKPFSEFPLTYDVTLVCHAGKVDLSTLSYKDESENLMKRVSEIQGGAISMRSMKREIRSLKKAYTSNPAVYPVRLNFRDTMGQAPSGGKSLEVLGKTLGIPKISSDLIDKSDMLSVLLKYPDLFFEYASRDATVTVLYASSIYGYNKEMAVTLTSASSKVAKMKMMEYLGCKNSKEFNAKYRGLESVSRGLETNVNNPGFIEDKNLEPLTEEIRDILNYASFAYHGGLNQSIEIGWYEGLTNDFDLQNAYPTAMTLVPDVNWEEPVVNELIREEMGLKHFWAGMGYNPMTPFFGRVRFEFPDYVKHPCIPINVEGRLVCPRSSEGYDVVYAAGPEVYLALKLGAKVFCERGFILNPLIRDDGTPSYSLSVVLQGLVSDRKTAKELFGNKSLEQEILKILVNSIYGKNAQNVVNKTRWNSYKQMMEAMGDSAITNPVSASLTTSYVRALLFATMNEAHEKGYKVYSVTTDGFIADIPDVETLESFDLYGLVPLTRNARLFLTSGDSDRIWEIKHKQEELLNLTTRGNMAPNVGGVCAHNSTKSGYPSGSLEDRAWFISSCLGRIAGVVYQDKVWTSFKDLSKGANFSVKDVERCVTMDFDMKRKPIRDSFRTVMVEFEGVTYEIANFDTEPFESVAEAKRYHAKRKLCAVLRTMDDWKIFWDKIDCNASGKRILKNGGLEWAKLVSCVMGYRMGAYDIPELDNRESVQDKCDWLNSLNLCKREFKKNDWKNARKPERQANMLSLAEIHDFLEYMQNFDKRIFDKCLEWFDEGVENNREGFLGMCEMLGWNSIEVARSALAENPEIFKLGKFQTTVDGVGVSVYEHFKPF